MNDSRIRIILGNASLARYPEGGGHWTCFLQHLLGLQALGHDVFFLELLRSTGRKEEDDRRISTFFRRMGEYGVADRCLLLVHSRKEKHLGLKNAQAYGRSIGEIEEICRSADLLWNYCAALRQPLLSLFRQRVFIDLDPGHLQVSALEWDMGLDDHDFFLTVGSKVHDPDCQVPTLGLTWRSFRPFVYLPLWEVTPLPTLDAPFTSVTQWVWGIYGRTAGF